VPERYSRIEESAECLNAPTFCSSLLISIVMMPWVAQEMRSSKHPTLTVSRRPVFDSLTPGANRPSEAACATGGGIPAGTATSTPARSLWLFLTVQWQGGFSLCSQVSNTRQSPFRMSASGRKSWQSFDSWPVNVQAFGAAFNTRNDAIDGSVQIEIYERCAFHATGASTLMEIYHRPALGPALGPVVDEQYFDGLSVPIELDSGLNLT
jgi:hypothetical protein